MEQKRGERKRKKKENNSRKISYIIFDDNLFYQEQSTWNNLNFLEKHRNY